MDRDDEIRKDVARLDRALDRIDEILQARTGRGADESEVMLLEKRQLAAIDRIVPLLKRRAETLGLDAPARKEDDAALESPIERMLREAKDREARS